ncbi:MAG: tRNA (guanosine(46)-N7)-methyltransferase TrmB [Bacteroidota bacterium]
MSKRNKLQKFAEIYSYPHVFENFNPKEPKLLGEQGKEVELKGQWASTFFQNEHPITLELACGKGDYTIGLARRFPDRNFIGVDIKGARIWRGAKTALEDNLLNVAFLRTRIEQLHYFFGAQEVADIWITFADPFLSKPNRRLTNPKFLDMFHPLLQPDGYIHLKTDSLDLYEYTLEVMQDVTNYKIVYQNDDIYSSELYDDALEIKTFYEISHLKAGKTIKYILLQRIES